MKFVGAGFEEFDADLGLALDTATMFGTSTPFTVHLYVKVKRYGAIFTWPGNPSASKSSVTPLSNSFWSRPDTRRLLYLKRRGGG